MYNYIISIHITHIHTVMYAYVVFAHIYFIYIYVYTLMYAYKKVEWMTAMTDEIGGRNYYFGSFCYFKVLTLPVKCYSVI